MPISISLIAFKAKLCSKVIPARQMVHAALYELYCTNLNSQRVDYSAI